jgi:predicted GH43/DUF377 family glycosyl hydrolase
MAERNGKRQHYRKDYKAAGTVFLQNSRKVSIQIINVSMDGIRFIMFNSHNIPILSTGDVIRVSFNIDDKDYSKLENYYIIKYTGSTGIGAKLINPVPYSKNVKNRGFWLRV